MRGGPIKVFFSNALYKKSNTFQLGTEIRPKTKNPKTKTKTQNKTKKKKKGFWGLKSLFLL